MINLRSLSRLSNQNLLTLLGEENNRMWFLMVDIEVLI